MGAERSSDRQNQTTAKGRALAVLLWLFGRMPLPLNRLLGNGLGLAFSLIPNRNSRIAKRNIALCFPDKSEREQGQLRRRTMMETGKGIAELGLFWTMPRDRTLGLIRQAHGVSVLDKAIVAGKGVLLAAPHLGAWELMCQYLASRTNCSILYKEPRDVGIENVITTGRERLGAELVRADAKCVRSLFRALGKGRLVGILPDQQPKRGQGEFAPFFGRQALTMVLFSKLAARTGAPLVIAWAERLPGSRGYDLHFEAGRPEIANDDTLQSVAALNQSVEACVRQCPEQYQWGYKRFSIRPDGEPPVY